MLTVSESFRSYIAPHVKQPERIKVIPNGFDEKRFKPIPHDNAVAQLITVCRLVPAKGTGCAAARLREAEAGRSSVRPAYYRRRTDAARSWRSSL